MPIPPPGASVPEIVPPKPTTSTRVLYPEGAEGDAEVILELVVDREGGVTDVRATSGDEPFATAAVAAAKSWRFEPARRDGRAIVARIRFRVTFTEPVAETKDPRPEPAPTERAPGGRADARTLEDEHPEEPPPPEQPLEVLVTADRPSPNRRSLTRAEVRQLPGAFGDPFRAIEILPGVTPLLSGVPFFFVRGAPPGNVGYFLDGIRVPLLYHVAAGPSVIHPGLVERVDLYPGGYPARYGRFAGGIVTAETTAPAHEWHGEGNVRLFDAGALVEGPFADRRGTVLLGGRYSYTAAVISALAPEVVLNYWDYQARASYDLGPSDRLSLFSFGAADFIGDEESDGSVRTLFDTEFHRLDLRYDKSYARGTEARYALTVGFDRTRFDGDDPTEVGILRDRLVGGRVEHRHRLSESAVLRSGLDATLDFFEVDARFDDEDTDGNEEEFRRAFSTRRDLAIGTHADVVLDPEPGVTVTPGLRLDFYESDGATALGIDPRISARFQIDERWAALHAFGIAHQPPSFIAPIPGFQIGGIRGGLQRSLQVASGVEAKLPWDVKGTLTVFNNVFLNMTDQLSLIRSEIDDDIEIETRSQGSTIGLELALQRRLTHRLGGFFSYTLSRSVRSLGRVHAPAAFDRTHVLNLAAGYHLGRRWRAGSRLTFYTGVPGEVRTEDGEAIDLDRLEHPPRTRPFYRVDLRIEKKWPIGSKGAWLAFVAEWLNATLSKEVINLECVGNRCTQEDFGPVTVPSIGLEGAF